jgi:transcription antitermination protein NusB
VQEVSLEIMNELNLSDVYPLSRKKRINGTRRLAREKVLQIFIAWSVCRTDIDELFSHIFYREFNFDDVHEIEKDKFLRPEEILELESDTRIDWKSESVQFGKNLLLNSIANSDKLESLIEEYANNWKLERIAQIDKALLIIAATEILDFEDIPPKVSINEALEIAKMYSTDKSKTFINGVLDSLLERFKKENMLHKSGRGLKNS